MIDALLITMLALVVTLLIGAAALMYQALTSLMIDIEEAYYD